MEMGSSCKLCALYLCVILFIIIDLLPISYAVEADSVHQPNKMAVIHGSICSYTIIVKEINDTSICPSMAAERPVKSARIRRRRHRSKKMYKSIAQVKMNGNKQRDQVQQDGWRELNSKLRTVERKLAMEVLKNSLLNLTLSRHGNMLRAAENLLNEHRTNFTKLENSITKLNKKVYYQRGVSRSLGNKLSSVMLDIVEVNQVLKKKVPSENTNLGTKDIQVQNVAKVRSCGITHELSLYRDCSDVYRRGYVKSGVYYITPNYVACPIPVYCDMEILPAGWLIILRRLNGSLNFKRNWDEYKNGFGNVVSEYWLGNDNTFLLTNQDQFELRVDLWDFEGNRVYAKYRVFKIEGERDKYRLHIGNYTGSAHDSLGKHNGMQFSTVESDNDNWDDYHCAKEWEGGWWYKNCWFAFLTGEYYNTSLVRYRGISWNDWKHEQLRQVEMKIRPLDEADRTDKDKTLDNYDDDNEVNQSVSRDEDDDDDDDDKEDTVDKNGTDIHGTNTLLTVDDDI